MRRSASTASRICNHAEGPSTFGRRKKNEQPESETLSPEADQFLKEATAEFNAKQDALNTEWRFDAFDSWNYDPESGVLTLEFSDGRTLAADGQLLGTYLVSGGTFEWAWNSPHFTDAITRDSQRVKALGKSLDMSYTQVGMLPVPDEKCLSYLCAIGLKASASLGMFRGAEDEVQPLIMVKNPRWI